MDIPSDASVKSQRPPDPSIEEYVVGIRNGDRSVLGRALTLVESNHRDHIKKAQELLQELLPHSGESYRIGITGVPGVGKSTFIESFGCNLTASGHRVAVLAVDPSSKVSGGSILGDKTRMPRLANDERAFVRPSPTGGSLGGVARKTRESIIVCEAAEFDVIIVETVGVGQSEGIAAEMVDFFLVLMLAGAGDELQGIKRGIREIADLIAINKADGDNQKNAERARQAYEGALQLMRSTSPNWQTPVVTVSSLENRGLDEIWSAIQGHRHILTESGKFEDKRRKQLLDWTWSMVEERLITSLRNHPRVMDLLTDLERKLLAGELTPTAVANQILSAFGVEER